MSGACRQCQLMPLHFFSRSFRHLQSLVSLERKSALVAVQSEVAGLHRPVGDQYLWETVAFRPAFEVHRLERSNGLGRQADDVVVVQVPVDGSDVVQDSRRVAADVADIAPSALSDVAGRKVKLLSTVHHLLKLSFNDWFHVSSFVKHQGLDIPIR